MERYDRIFINNSGLDMLNEINCKKLLEMDDLENKQNFNFGAEIITTEVTAQPQPPPSPTITTASKEMLSVNSRHEQQQQQHGEEPHQQKQDEQQNQCCHHLQMQQQNCVVTKAEEEEAEHQVEMNEMKIVEQQVLKGNEMEQQQQRQQMLGENDNNDDDDKDDKHYNTHQHFDEEEIEEQKIQTNIVMKTKVTEKCGMEVVDKNLVVKCSGKDHKHHHHHHHHNNHNHHHHHHYNNHHHNQQHQSIKQDDEIEKENHLENENMNMNGSSINSNENDFEKNSIENDNVDHQHSYLNSHPNSNSPLVTNEDGINQDEDDMDSDETSSDSNYSDISGLSDVSGREWKPISARPLQWVQKQIHSGANPRDILSQILPHSHQLPPGLNDMALWRLLASMLSEPPRRQKLRNVNTFNDVVNLIEQSTNIIVLTGAGVSVSCGIPDFRSSDGIYSRLAKDYPDLPDPQAMFDINYFSRDPRPFYKFAREIYPGQFKPSPCHRFIKLLEDKNKLLRNYTQNIDTLEQVAGIRNVIECHGSFSTASCTKCKHKCDAEAIRADIFAQRIPVCPQCQPNVQQSVDASEPVSSFELRQLVENGIMKPDIVFFGEGLPEEFHTVMASDKDKCDLLIVIGSSLKVRPVALIPSSIPSNVPQILINREQLHHLEFDVELLGDSDVIINQLCHCLGKDWEEICYDSIVLKECKELLPYKNQYDEEDYHDHDTQSIVSNDVQSQTCTSGVIYTDSGFESSASSTTHHIINDNLLLNENTEIGSAGATIKHNQQYQPQLLHQEQQGHQQHHQQQLPPELIEGPNDCHTFAERLAAPLPLPTATTSIITTISNNQRHYSVDSTKDSGIGQYCNESSNSSALTPPLPCNDVKQNPYDVSTSSLSLSPTSSASSTVATTPTNMMTPNIENSSNSKNSNSNINNNNKMAINSTNVVALDKKPKRNDGRIGTLTAADRLPSGCYYCHERTFSYVFPGAQVTWCSESEDEDDDLIEDIDNEDGEENVEEDDEDEENQDENDYCDEEEEKDESSNLMNEAEDDEDDTCEYTEDDDGVECNNDDSKDEASSSIETEIIDDVIIKDPKTNETTTTTSKTTFLKRHSNGLDMIVEATDTLTKTTKTLEDKSNVNGILSSELLLPPPNKKSRNSFESSSVEATASILTTSTNSNSNFCLTNTNPNSNNSSTTKLEPLLQPQ